MRLVRSAAASAGCVVLGLLQAVPASAAGPVKCEAFGMSPDFARDRVAMCVSRAERDPSKDNTATLVYVTRNGGRSWSRAAATGLTFTPATSWAQVLFSPRYADDRTVYVVGDDQGMFTTTNLGATFTLTDPAAQASPGWVFGPRLTPYVATSVMQPGAPVPPLPGSPHTVLAYMGGRPAKIDPPVHVPVTASPEDNRWFLLPPGFPDDDGLVVARRAATAVEPARYLVYRCDGSLACPVPEHEFTPGHELLFAGLHPDFAKNRTAWVVTYGNPVLPAGFSHEIWRSTDGGATFSRWREAEKAIAGSIAQLAEGTFNITITYSRRHRATFLLLSGNADARRAGIGVVASLYRSADGRRWTRIGHRDRGDAGAPKVFPLAVDYGYAPAPLWSAADGQTFSLGERLRDFGTFLYCSRDGGRSWRTTCG